MESRAARAARRAGGLLGIMAAASLAGCGQAGGPGAGEAATWTLLHPARVTAESTVIEVGVVRLGCSSGVTGELRRPEISYETDRIVIEIDVERFEGGAADCQGNDSVPLMVELTEPIGDRELVDGACLEGEAVGTAFCETAVRWPL